MEFCSKRQIDYRSAPISEALEFLLGLYNKGLSYSTINTVRSDLSSILRMDCCDNFGSH